MKQKEKTFQLVLTGSLLAILILLSSVPFLGFIPIGPLNATTLHIPVIIGSLILGPKRGAFLGACFGLISMIRATIIVTPVSFVFSPFVSAIGTNEMGHWQALLIAFIPRILIGIVPYFVYRGLVWRFGNRLFAPSLFIAGIAGGLTNTILVMNMIYFFFQKEYAEVIGQAGNAVYGAILLVIFTQGIPEAIVAGIATAAVTTVLWKFIRRRGTQDWLNK